MAIDLKKLFIRRLQEEMEARQVSGNELAKRAGIGQSTVSRILNGKQELTLSRIGRLAEALDTHAWALLLDSSRIEERIIKPVTDLADPNKVVRLRTEYGQIFGRPRKNEEKSNQVNVRTRKKR